MNDFEDSVSKLTNICFQDEIRTSKEAIFKEIIETL